MSSIRWVGLIQSIRGLKRKKDWSPPKNRETASSLPSDLSCNVDSFLGHTHNLVVLFLWKTLPNTHLQRVPRDLIVCSDAASSFYDDPTYFRITHNWQGQGGSLGAGSHRGPLPSIPSVQTHPLGTETKASWVG